MSHDWGDTSFHAQGICNEGSDEQVIANDDCVARLDHLLSDSSHKAALYSHSDCQYTKGADSGCGYAAHVLCCVWGCGIIGSSMLVSEGFICFASGIESQRLWTVQMGSYGQYTQLDCAVPFSIGFDWSID